MAAWDRTLVAQYVFLAGLFWLVLTLWICARRYYRRSDNSKLPPPLPRLEKSGPRRIVIAASGEAQPCEVQMQELSRHLMGELNTRLRLVQLATVQAEAAAARLETALAKAELRDLGDIGRDEAALRPLVGWEFASNVPAGMQGETAPDSANPPAERSPENCLPLDARRRQRIRALANAGYPSEAIAERVGSHVADVELVLSLIALQH